MNVLVYAGPEVIQTSLARSISLLKSLLVPNYTVQAITAQSLSSHPWPSTGALLVIPACNQKLSFSSTTSNTIKSFVEHGGALLGLRAGVRSSILETGLKFQDAVSGAHLTCYFYDGDLSGPKTISVTCSQGELSGTAEDVPLEIDAVESSSLQVLARHSEGSKPAAIVFRSGMGRVSLWSIPLETSMSSENAGNDDSTENKQKSLFCDTLRLLGLQLPPDSSSAPPQPLPLILTGSPSRTDIVQQILSSISLQIPGTLVDENNTFEFVDAQPGLEMLRQARSQSWHSVAIPVIAFSNGSLPQPSDTPLFNLEQYYSTLSAVRQEKTCPSEPSPWGIGEALQYGEVVTSTQTMLDKNPRLLSDLPVPFLSLASHQVAGRGRGGNTWVSPAGCLQYSLLLRVPLSQIPASKLVFVQYLFALAVVEACRHENVLGRVGEAVKLKWPNDVYIVEGEEKRKIGGILVNTSFTGGMVSIVIGAGLNVLNGPPIASLSQLLSPEAQSRLSLEKTAATIMAIFEPMWNIFVSERGSFRPFIDQYLDRWLHSDQLVTVTTTTPHRRVRISGITLDHGLLRTVPERDSWISRASGQNDFIDLQPDGNTFDLMSGLIMTKK